MPDDPGKTTKLRRMERLFKEGTVLFRQGDATREMYILLDGELEVLVDGERVALLREPGCYLGEMSTLLGVPRTATVRTTRVSKLIVVAATGVKAFLNHSPQLGLKLATMLASRLRDTTRERHDTHAVLERVEGHHRKMLSVFRPLSRKYPDIAKVLTAFGELESDGLGVVEAAARRAASAKAKAVAEAAAQASATARAIQGESAGEEAGAQAIAGEGAPAEPAPVAVAGEAAPADPAPKSRSGPGSAAGDDPIAKFATHPVPAIEAVFSDPAVAAKLPLYGRPIACPLHPGKPFEARCMKSKSMVVEPNKYDVPVYLRAASEDKTFVDYTLLEVQVCPKCFYAASDLSYFDDPRKKGGERPKELDKKAIRELVENAARRAELAGADPEELFSPKRGPEAAIKAFQLAAETARVVAESHPDRSALSRLREGNFHLKIALIHEKAGRKEQAKASLETGYAAILQAYSHLEGPNLYRAIFQVITLGLDLGKDKDVGTYFSAFQKMKSNYRSMPEADKTAFNNYFKRARDLWQMREEDKKAAAAAPDPGKTITSDEAAGKEPA